MCVCVILYLCIKPTCVILFACFSPQRSMLTCHLPLAELTDTFRANLGHWRQWISAHTPSVSRGRRQCTPPSSLHPWLVEIKLSLHPRQAGTENLSALIGGSTTLIWDCQSAQGLKLISGAAGQTELRRSSSHCGRSFSAKEQRQRAGRCCRSGGSWISQAVLG